MNRNLTMMTDLYQLTMMNGYYLSGVHEHEAVFDLFFRSNEQINYGVFAGLEQAIDYIKSIKFTHDDIAYLKSLNLFDDGFLDYLKDFSFTGDIYSMEEGEIVFPSEPILVVKAPLIEAQLIETTLLNIISHQTLIATKASRIVQAANGASVIEFGLRRAQGPDAGIYGARASIIGGCSGTSNVLSGQMFDILVKGTHSHSWVMSFDSELEAFEAFAKVYPDNCLLLVDTFDTLNSGVPNAIKVFEKLRAKGHKPVGIRLDSGDLAYLSKAARKMLDDAGFSDAIIFASNDIDEYLLSELTLQEAKIDAYGVGTKLITSHDLPSLGAVYKMAQIQDKPCMKFSDAAIKMTNPGFKTVYRIYKKEPGKDQKDSVKTINGSKKAQKASKKAFADLIALKGEELKKPLILTHETERWKTSELDDYDYRELLIPIFKDGKAVYDCPPISESVNKYRSEAANFWDEYKRLVRPHIYKVDLSDKLYNLKQDLLRIRQA